MKMIAKWNRPDNLFPVTLRGMDDLVHALFGRLNTEFSPEWMHDCGCEPQLELETTEDAVVARLPIPGCKPENINVEVLGDADDADLEFAVILHNETFPWVDPRLKKHVSG